MARISFEEFSGGQPVQSLKATTTPTIKTDQNSAGSDLRAGFQGAIDGLNRGVDREVAQGQQGRGFIGRQFGRFTNGLRTAGEMLGSLGEGAARALPGGTTVADATSAATGAVMESAPVRAGVDLVKSGVEALPDPIERTVKDTAGGAFGALQIAGALTGPNSVLNRLTRVRTIEPDISTPYVQASEEAIADGVDMTRRSKLEMKGNSGVGSASIGRRTGEAVIDSAVLLGEKTTQMYRSVVEGATERITAKLDRDAIRKNTGVPIQQAEANIADMYINAVSPGVKGKKKSLQGITQNTQSATRAVKTITQNRANLQFRDIETNEVIKGELPSNLWEFGGAIGHQKSATYKLVLEKLDKTSDQAIDPERINIAMQEIIEDPVYAGIPEVKKRADQALKQFSENEYSPAQIERLIQIENDRLQAFYRGSGSQADAIVSAIVANNLRDILDETVEAATGSGIKELKMQYGDLKAIERDVVHRALHNSQAREAGLIDMFSVRSIGDVALGAAGDLSALKAGAAQIAGESFIKALNDRDALINRMFLVSERTYGNLE